eukprot:TRINITY_DN36424_c0_g1_i1.p1 TRINITY_DN36424_c0_g1~~TRINITY_DN36424_c0_g1_i1.p1  ORF type:complete len:112 (+),score=19.61 TRINITY_DN36424_c0_g1_i1:33-368(+)
MMRRPPRSTLSSSSAASDVYKRQEVMNWAPGRSQYTAPLRLSSPVPVAVERAPQRSHRPPSPPPKAQIVEVQERATHEGLQAWVVQALGGGRCLDVLELSLIHISEPTRPY